MWSAVKKKHVGYCKQNYNVVGLATKGWRGASREKAEAVVYTWWPPTNYYNYYHPPPGRLPPPKNSVFVELHCGRRKAGLKHEGYPLLLSCKLLLLFALLPWARFSSKKCHANLNLLPQPRQSRHAPEKMESVASVAFFLSSFNQMKGMTCMMCLSHSSTATLATTLVIHDSMTLPQSDSRIAVVLDILAYICYTDTNSIGLHSLHCDKLPYSCSRFH